MRQEMTQLQTSSCTLQQKMPHAHQKFIKRFEDTDMHVIIGGMTKNFTKIVSFVAVPVVAAVVFAGLSIGFSSDTADAATYLPTTDAPVASIKDAAPDAELVAYSPNESEAVAVFSPEVQDAVDALNHAIEMANEVRVAMLSRINQGLELVANHQGTAIADVHMHSESVALHNAIEAALPQVESQLSEILASAQNDIDKIAALNTLREGLVAVYEPDGPYDNPLNLPAEWLRDLPNGDPRNLPTIQMAPFFQFIGPESLVAEYLDTDNIPLQNSNVAVGTQSVFQCIGPNNTTDGHCELRLHSMARTSINANRDIVFAEFDDNTNRFTSLPEPAFASLFQSGDTVSEATVNVLREIGLRSCWQIQTIEQNSNSFESSMNRDSQGFIFFEPSLDIACVERILLTDLGLSPNPSRGGNSQYWRRTELAPTAPGESLFTLPIEQSATYAIVQLAREDSEIAGIVRSVAENRERAEFRRQRQVANTPVDPNARFVIFEMLDAGLLDFLMD